MSSEFLAIELMKMISQIESDNKIYSYILRASFVVAEVTTRNPNVLYELGLAHMLEKDCIILTQTFNSEVPSI